MLGRESCLDTFQGPAALRHKAVLVPKWPGSGGIDLGDKLRPFRFGRRLGEIQYRNRLGVFGDA
jgi:hypothetical protein